MLQEHDMALRTPESTYHNDEIDLRDLFLTLWRSKWVIIVTTAVLTIAAIVYVKLAPATYRAQAQTSAPDISDLFSYNLLNNVLQLPRPTPDDDASTVLPAAPAARDLTPRTAYAIFVSQLQSASLREEFFENTYLPGHPEAQTSAAKAQLWDALNRDLKIQTTSNAQNPGSTTLTLQGAQPDKLAEWVNQYAEMARQAANQQLISNLKAAIQARIDEIDTRIEGLRAIAAAKRKDDIIRLNDALKLAQATRMAEPLSAGSLVASYQDQTLFLRGSNALQAEINLLKQRANDDPYIPQLPNLLYARAELQKADPNPQPLSVATIDQSATVPSLIRPRKRLVVALGFLIGLMLGVIIALIREKVRSTPRVIATTHDGVPSV